MDKDDYLGREALARRAAEKADSDLTGHVDREITPADGSVAGSGQLVCVFCAPCQRWIDCYDGIPPEIAHQRHGALFH
jgi:hypothetical protein